MHNKYNNFHRKTNPVRISQCSKINAIINPQLRDKRQPIFPRRNTNRIILSNPNTIISQPKYQKITKRKLFIVEKTYRNSTRNNHMSAIRIISTDINASPPNNLRTVLKQQETHEKQTDQMETNLKHRLSSGLPELQIQNRSRRGQSELRQRSCRSLDRRRAWRTLR